MPPSVFVARLAALSRNHASASAAASASLSAHGFQAESDRDRATHASATWGRL
jgi:hypothetical protein